MGMDNNETNNSDNCLTAEIDKKALKKAIETGKYYYLSIGVIPIDREIYESTIRPMPNDILRLVNLFMATYLTKVAEKLILLSNDAKKLEEFIKTHQPTINEIIGSFDDVMCSQGIPAVVIISAKEPLYSSEFNEPYRSFLRRYEDVLRKLSDEVEKRGIGFVKPGGDIVVLHKVFRGDIDYFLKKRKRRKMATSSMLGKALEMIEELRIRKLEEYRRLEEYKNGKSGGG